MAYTYRNSKGVLYTLHGRTTKLASGKSRTLYFFAKTEKEGALDRVPDGYTVVESRNGLPFVKKIK